MFPSLPSRHCSELHRLAETWGRVRVSPTCARCGFRPLSACQRGILARGLEREEDSSLWPGKLGVLEACGVNFRPGARAWARLPANSPALAFQGQLPLAFLSLLSLGLPIGKTGDTLPGWGLHVPKDGVADLERSN